MAGSRKLTVEVLGNAAGAEAALGGLGSHVGRIGQSMMRFGATMTAGVTLPIVAAFKKSIDAARESNAIGRVTEQIIKQTGGAARLTATQIGNLANSLAMQTGVSDELIQSSENVLLTFKAIHDQAGKGNDVFTRATKAALDLSQVFGQDATKSAVQLGKALEDPVKGMGALRRVGVTFTEGQKAVIAAMVDTGNMMGAQKEILKAIEGQVGGAAAAAADPMKKLGQVLDNLQETIGNILLPIIERFGAKLGELAAWFGALSPRMQNVIVAGLAIAAAIGPVVTIVGALVTAIAAIGVGPFLLLAAGVAYAATHFDQFKAVAQVVWDWLKVNIPAAIEVIKGKIAEFVATVGQWWAKHGDDILSKARMVWDWLKVNIPAAIEVIKGKIAEFVAIVKALWDRWGDDLVAKAKQAWNWIQEEIVPTLLKIKDYIVSALGAIKRFWDEHHTEIMSVATRVWNTIAAGIRATMNLISGVITTVLRLIRGDWSGAWDTMLGTAKSAASNMWKEIKGLAGLLWSAMQAAWDGMLKVATAMATVMQTEMRKLPGKLVAALAGAGKALYQAGVDLMHGLANGILQAGEKLVKDAIHKVTSWIPDWLKKPLGVRSPSTVTDQIGRYISEGLANGIIAGIPGVANATGALATETIKAISAMDLDSTKMTGAGHAIINGFIKGIAAKFPALRDSLTKMTLSLSSDLEAGLLLERFEAVGGNVAKATAKGVKSKASLAVAAAKKMAKEVGDAAQEAVRVAQAAAAKIDAAVSGVLGRASAGKSLSDAKENQTKAETDLAKVQGRSATITGRITEAETKLAAAKDKSTEITAEEQVAIEQATAALKTAREEHAKGTITTAELTVAEHRLAAAQEASTAATSDVADAERELVTLRAEQEGLAKDLADAQRVLTDAEDRVTLAMLDAYKANKNLIEQGPDAVAAWEAQAKAAGITADQLARVAFNGDLAGQVKPPSAVSAGVTQASTGVRTAAETIRNGIVMLTPTQSPEQTAGEEARKAGAVAGVTINVAGSVITQNELVSMVRDGISRQVANGAGVLV